jgi:acryloyl-coenzyme A reductase
MRAAVLHQAGGPDSFVLQDLPIPAPADDEVLVEVQACGVSFKDVVERNGTYRRDVTFPLVMGLEISGIVRQLGACAKRLKPGDLVCSKAFSSCGNCRYCRTGRETTCPNRRPVRGGYAEFVALPEDAFAVVSASIPFEESCTLGPAAGVALNAVRDVARLGMGESVLVTGATGAVGWACLQLSRLAGARVIAVTRDAARRPALLEIGASDVVISQAGESFAPRIRDLTAGAGVDVVLDNVGSAVFDACFDSLALHGRFAMIGQLSGGQISINPARIFFKRAAILGVGSVSRAQLEAAIALAEEGLLKPRISHRFGLEDVGHAHRLVESSAAFGRVILTPNLKKETPNE